MSQAQRSSGRRLNGGFSLIEIMLTLGLVGVVSFLLASQMNEAAKLQKYSAELESMNSLMAGIGFAMASSPGACNVNISNLSASAFNPVPLRNATPSPIPVGLNQLEFQAGANLQTLASVGQVLSPGQIQVRVLTFNVERELVPNTSYSGRLLVSFRKQGPFLGSKDIERSIPLRLSTSSAGGGMVQIDSCSIGTSLGCRYYIKPLSGGLGQQAGQGGGCSLHTPSGLTAPNEIRCGGHNGFSWKLSVAICKSCDDGTQECFDNAQERFTVDQYEVD
jgi:type II secretory pathway pseudopilin PulG